MWTKHPRVDLIVHLIPSSTAEKTLLLHFCAEQTATNALIDTDPLSSHSGKDVKIYQAYFAEPHKEFHKSERGLLSSDYG